MSEKRFKMGRRIDVIADIYDSEKGRLLVLSEVIDLLNSLCDENEQLRQQLQEYKENWDDMVELATKTSLRNVELDEQIGQLRKELDDCEKFRYAIFKRIGELTDEL